MANTIITPSIIAKVGLAQLENNLVMGKKVYRDYSREFVKVGDTISVRRPVKFTAQDGAVAINQDVTEGKFALSMDKRKHVSWSFSTQDLTLSIEEYNERYIKPAAIALANQIDYDLTGLYNKVWNWVGTPASPVDCGAQVTTPMLVVMAVIYAVLRSAETIQKAIGDTGTNVMSRIMGLVLAALAVQTFFSVFGPLLGPSVYP